MFGNNTIIPKQIMKYNVFIPSKRNSHNILGQKYDHAVSKSVPFARFSRVSIDCYKTQKLAFCF